MTAFLNASENDVINHFFRGTDYAQPNGGAGLHLAAYEAVPAEDNTGAQEMQDANYLRQLVAQAAAEWSVPTATATGVEIENVNPVVYPAPAANGADIVGIGAAPGAAAAPIMAGSLNNPVSVVAGQPITFAAGSIKFAINEVTGMTDLMGIRLLNHIFRGIAMANITSMLLHLATTNPSKAGTGAVPVAVAGYAPISMGPSAPLWSDPALTDGESSLVSTVPFTSPTAAWNGINGHYFVDNAGDVLLRNVYPSARNFSAGSTVEALAGVIKVVVR